MSESNREEAFRVKEIALKKMESADFGSAKEILLDAQKLFPELEDISQLLTVCNVHCAAKKRVEGKMYWYGILQLEVPSDEAIIKTQYHKLALSIHPDKNKFAGAEAAFKLVKQAHSELCDPTKSSQYEIKTKSFVSKYFSSICPHCHTRCRFPMPCLDKMVRCLDPKCKLKFVAFNSEKQPMPTSSRHCTEARGEKGNMMAEARGDKGNMMAEARGDKGNMVAEATDLGIKFKNVNIMTYGVHGEIWALYDSIGLPRSYAKIKYYDCSTSKIHLNWLTYVPMNREERKWADKELPVACGNFSLDKDMDILEVTKGMPIFSHMVNCKEVRNLKKDKKRKLVKDKETEIYAVYPCKGEVWALYKGWCRQWSARTDNHGPYEYEVVEVLSEMSAKNGVTVRPMVRIKDFVSLFAAAKDKSSYDIPSRELLRFSHRIPFFRITGVEKELNGPNIPEGFLQLETRCLPANLDVAFSSLTLDSWISISRKMDPGDEHIAQNKIHSETQVCRKVSADYDQVIHAGQNTALQKNARGCNQFADSCQKHCLSPSIYVYPDTDFHKFAEGRICEKFERGQIWALYCSFDTMPKYYGWINKVELEPFSVNLTWLEACPQLEQEKRWLEQYIPISCGLFKVRNQTAHYETTGTFSHLVHAREFSKESEFEILPQVGEIWAIYMNWAPDWDPSSTNSCDFAIGEIIEHTQACTKLCFLAKVDGYTSVFKADKQKGVLEIPTSENLRFSHRVPHFCLTEESGGKLRGLYELDPGSIPDVFLRKYTPRLAAEVDS
ncbi:hypothetical protein ACP70R_007565 [Stipagrostis hirtigluma subsp. patula]